MAVVRKTFETVRLYDPAIDWDAIRSPTTHEEPCPTCAGASASASEGAPRCDRCVHAGVVQVHDYEPYDEVRYSTEREYEKLGKHWLPGAEPIVFVYQRLTRKAMQDFVTRAFSTEDRYVRSFQAGVIEVRIPDMPVWRPRLASRAGFVTMDDKDLAQLEERGVEWPDLLEIGAEVYQRSELPFGFEPRFLAPPSSVAAWTALSRRSAARSRVGALPSSDEPKGP